MGKVTSDKGMALLIATSGRGRVVKRPSRRVIDTMVTDLRRNDHIVLEQQDGEREGDWYIQVLLCENGTFQLEHRDGIAAEHYQTRTVSREKALRALLGWAAAEPGWRDAFMWNNIGSMFTPATGEGEGATQPSAVVADTT